jgi:putative FmdB family regulatory protein
MPTYEYKCPKCDSIEETNIPHKEEYRPDCFKCGFLMDKMVYKPAVHFKGSGFYQTDYKDK